MLHRKPRRAWWLLILAFLALVLFAQTADAAGRWRGRWFGGGAAWQGGYAHPAWGTSVALVVPPTARFQTHYQWGVPSAYMTRIGPQMGPGTVIPYGGRPTPAWPGHTNQLGVYPLRGPW